MSISVETLALAKKNTKQAVEEAVTSVYRYKGSVETFEDLPTSGQKVGDVYNVEKEAGRNYAWDGSNWDALGIAENLGDIEFEGESLWIEHNLTDFHIGDNSWGNITTKGILTYPEGTVESIRLEFEEGALSSKAATLTSISVAKYHGASEDSLTGMYSGMSITRPSVNDNYFNIPVFYSNQQNPYTGIALFFSTGPNTGDRYLIFNNLSKVKIKYQLNTSQQTINQDYYNKTKVDLLISNVQNNLTNMQNNINNDINNVQNRTNSAYDTANTAYSRANNAQSNASNAKKTANNAYNAANTASNTANTAYNIASAINNADYSFTHALVNSSNFTHAFEYSSNMSNAVSNAVSNRGPSIWANHSYNSFTEYASQALNNHSNFVYSLWYNNSNFTQYAEQKLGSGSNMPYYLWNDNSFKNYATNFVSNITNDTLNAAKAYTDSKFDISLKKEVVQTLPAEGEEDILYLVPKVDAEIEDVYDEYIWTNNDWEKIGSTATDLSGYYTSNEVDNIASNLNNDISNVSNQATCAEALAHSAEHVAQNANSNAANAANVAQAAYDAANAAAPAAWQEISNVTTNEVTNSVTLPIDKEYDEYLITFNRPFKHDGPSVSNAFTNENPLFTAQLGDGYLFSNSSGGKSLATYPTMEAFYKLERITGNDYYIKALSKNNIRGSAQEDKEEDLITINDATNGVKFTTSMGDIEEGITMTVYGKGGQETE